MEPSSSVLPYFWYPKKCTCSIWAFIHWIKYGGSLNCHPSRNFKLIPHVTWISPEVSAFDGGVYSYIPITPLTGWRCLWDSIWFEGKIIEHSQS